MGFKLDYLFSVNKKPAVKLDEVAKSDQIAFSKKKCIVDFS